MDDAIANKTTVGPGALPDYAAAARQMDEARPYPSQAGADAARIGIDTGAGAALPHDPDLTPGGVRILHDPVGDAERDAFAERERKEAEAAAAASYVTREATADKPAKVDKVKA